MRRALLLVTFVACGDNLSVDTALHPSSGTRLKLQQYRYEDGTLQADQTAFYDTSFHATCTPKLWADGALRCVPLGADVARFTDSACTTAIGLAESPVRRPTHFLGYDTVDHTQVPARIYRVTGTTDAAASYYQLRDGMCQRDLDVPFATDYFALGELEPTDVAQFLDGEVGAGRLGLQVRETLDGLLVYRGVRDRELDLRCTPTLRADGVACEPTDADTAPAEHFLDPACRQPALRAPKNQDIPRMMTVHDAAGCLRFHAVGAEAVVTRLYRRVGDVCMRADDPAEEHVFGLGAPVVLAPLERAIEDAPERRLQHVVLSPAAETALRFESDRLVDSATRNECVTRSVGDVTWCVPADMERAMPLYATGCTLPVNVVEVREPTCRPATFAAGLSFDEEALEIYAIGDPVTTPLYHFTGAGCAPYFPEPGHVLRALGPALPADTFLRAAKFAERDP
ncbi:MAG: hypothetical protein SFX73_12580 [Kofleriaceae bacterium]|nr:hypothetical protein [Kofleriaceae bacterium]